MMGWICPKCGAAVNPQAVVCPCGPAGFAKHDPCKCKGRKQEVPGQEVEDLKRQHEELLRRVAGAYGAGSSD